MGRTIQFIICTVFLLFGLFYACAGMKMTHDWKDKKYANGYLQNVMVVGVARTLDKRRMFERELTQQFSRNGVKAIMSIDVVPPNQELNRATIKAVAKKHKMDTVFLTRLISIKEEETYHPPIYAERVAPQGYSFTDYSFVVTEEQYTTMYDVKLESRLYKIATEKMIWTGLSETLDYKTADEVMIMLSRLIMAHLQDQGLLQPE
jgi:hypothetical protein